MIGPTLVVDADGRGAPRPAGARDVLVLLVRAGAPIALLPLPGAPDPVQPADVVRLLDDGAIARLDAPAPAPVAADGITVAVCTRDRPEHLARALPRLRELAPAPAEVLVVDSASRTNDVAALAAAAGARCVRVDQPGLSRARNHALMAARTAWVAFTDDDAEVPRTWAGAMAAGAARSPLARCVLGPVVPAGILARPHELFEVYGGLNRGFAPRVTGAEFLRGWRSPPTWQLGAGASMAVHREHALALGGFDAWLGAGVAAACSEDSDFCYRVLRDGGTIVYEPAAWVMHHHRSTMRELRRQLFGYGRGHTAAQWKAFVEYGDRRALGRIALGLPLLQARRALKSLLGLSGFPLSLIASETAGQLLGPWSWRRGNGRP